MRYVYGLTLHVSRSWNADCCWDVYVSKYLHAVRVISHRPLRLTVSLDLALNLVSCVALVVDEVWSRSVLQGRKKLSGSDVSAKFEVLVRSLKLVIASPSRTK